MTAMTNAKDAVSQSYESAKQGASDTLKSVGIEVDTIANVARDKTAQLQDFASEELHARPVRAIVVAAAIGLVVGMLARR